MHLLLDTHALIWWLLNDRRLSKKACAAIADDGNTTFVSAASAWEIATKHRIGKLPSASMLVANIGDAIAAEGFSALPVDIRHGQMAGALPGAHGDPFDRMLMAQALLENLLLVSNETVFDGFGVHRYW